MTGRGGCICERLGPVDEQRRCAACPKRQAQASESGPVVSCPYGSGEHRKRHEVLAERSLHVPAALRPDQPAFKIVAVRFILTSGAIGDYAVYAGVGDRQWVTDWGSKLAFDDAALLFPGIVRARYR